MYTWVLLVGFVAMVSCKTRSGDASKVQSGTKPASDNVPKLGRSYFDHVFFDAKKKDFDIPFPLEKLGERVKAYSKNDYKLSMLLFPRGRGLKRNLAGEKFFRYPRVVLIASNTKYDVDYTQPVLDNNLYITYNELDDQLEVLSYNEAAGRFEFQIVRDYAADKKPLLEYASRGLCTSCHRAEAPISLRFPCVETHNNIEIAKKLTKELESTPHFVKNHYFGYDLGEASSACQHFADSSDQPNSLVHAQRVWEKGCAGGTQWAQNNCKKKLMKRQFDSGDIAKLDKDLRELPGWVLDDYPQNLWKENNAQLLSPGDLGSLLSDVPDELNPITGTQKAVGGSINFPSNMFDTLFYQASESKVDVDATITKVVKDNPALFSGKALNRNEFIAAFMKETKMKDPPKLLAEVEMLMPPPVEAMPPKIDFSKDGKGRQFFQYCGSCHAVQKTDLFFAEDEEGFWKKIASAKGKILERMDWEKTKKPMPPKNSAEYRQMELKGERAAMIKDLL